MSLTAQGADISLSKGPSAGGNTLALQLVGSNSAAQAVGRDELVTKTNYLIGNDSSAWLTNISNYGQVEYRNVYAGVDLVYSGDQGQLTYDFEVAPGANAGAIRLAIQGAESMNLDARGDLVLQTAGGNVVEQAPVVYQVLNGTRQAVSSAFVLDGNGQVGFQLGAYDHTRALVIDPTLNYSSYLPGASYAVAVDSSGDVYVTGAASTNYPTTPGAFETSGDGVFVAELNPTGTAEVFATYLGDSAPLPSGGSAVGGGIALAASGYIYVTGFAGTDFPTTIGFAIATSTSTTPTGFVSVLDPGGSGLLYSTYLPGVGDSQEWINAGAIAVNSSGDAYVTGTVDTTGFVTTSNAFQATDPGTGDEAFFTEINPFASGSPSSPFLMYSTYLGGSVTNLGNNKTEGTGIAAYSGTAYLTGVTDYTNFPTTTGAFESTYSAAVSGGLRRHHQPVVVWLGVPARFDLPWGNHRLDGHSAHRARGSRRHARNRAGDRRGRPRATFTLRAVQTPAGHRRRAISRPPRAPSRLPTRARRGARRWGMRS